MTAFYNHLIRTESCRVGLLGDLSKPKVCYSISFRCVSPKLHIGGQMLCNLSQYVAAYTGVLISP